MQDFSSPQFARFIAPGVDRLSTLKTLLTERGLIPAIAELSGSRNLIIGPEKRGSTPSIVLIAHYDRAEGSPGANDNSAAVFSLIEAAERLKQSGTGKWLMIFTDSEEAAANGGAKAQGSFALAQGFKSLNLESARFFIFDACGRGNSIIVSTALDRLFASDDSRDNSEKREAIRQLRLEALEAGRVRTDTRMLLAPTPFSDDAGFLAAGLLAQTITVLPMEEAALWLQALRGQDRLESALINREARSRLLHKGGIAGLPETWKLLHSSGDRPESLWKEAFGLIATYAVSLCQAGA